MKSSLLIRRSAVIFLLLCSGFHLNGQQTVFSEDFSGFTTGTHTTPSTNDVSGALDPKTHSPGWTGSKIYSAGGEIKLGTSTVAGWIETPSINLINNEGDLLLKFDISTWPGDATTIQVYLNGSEFGDPVTPTEIFQTTVIPITGGTSSGKIRFASLTKRFFLDKIIIEKGSVSDVRQTDQSLLQPKVFPNPATDFIKIDNTEGFCRLEISGISGRVLKVVEPLERNTVEVSLDGLSPGIYFLRFVSGRRICTSRLIIE